MSKDLYLSKESYIAAMIRIREIIAQGQDLIHFDDTTTIGSKDTQCSWGLCWSEKSHWPDSKDYLWPEEPERVAVKYLCENSRCPMDTRQPRTGIDGCFWTCRVFQRELTTPTREETLSLYDARIAEVQHDRFRW